ncbi:hypothetical protein [Providencia sp. PROV137]|uniref:hypothetical protein n=1 Tax=Providencia sp. PROV137 TaxID=2949847 RepID=UPI0023494F10|nr:hypothetical protein [Providencia sp. PROV137]
MSVHLNQVIKSPKPFITITKGCSKFSHKIKEALNINSKKIELKFEGNTITLNESKIVRKLKSQIETADKLEKFKISEKKIQIGSTINRAIDETREELSDKLNKTKVSLTSSDKKEIFHRVAKKCGISESDIDTNSSQQFIKHLLSQQKQIQKVITHDLFLNKEQPNGDNAAVTKYVIGTLNARVQEIFFPDINFKKIKDCAESETKELLENKLNQANNEIVTLYFSIEKKR